MTSATQQAATPRPVPTSPITATLAALPPGPSAERTRIVLQAFADAYRRQDVAGILALFPDLFNYWDCDYARRENHFIRDKDTLAAWLRARFADHDRLEVTNIVIGGYGSTKPITGGIEVIRTSDALRARGRSRTVGIKVGLTEAGDRIDTIALEGNSACPRGE